MLISFLRFSSKIPKLPRAVGGGAVEHREGGGWEEGGEGGVNAN